MFQKSADENNETECVLLRSLMIHKLSKPLKQHLNHNVNTETPSVYHSRSFPANRLTNRKKFLLLKKELTPIKALLFKFLAMWPHGMKILRSDPPPALLWHVRVFFVSACQQTSRFCELSNARRCDRDFECVRLSVYKPCMGYTLVLSQYFMG